MVDDEAVVEELESLSTYDEPPVIESTPPSGLASSDLMNDLPSVRGVGGEIKLFNFSVSHGKCFHMVSAFTW